MATTTTATDRTAVLEEIHVANNVRALDADHVHALAGSIRLQGMLVPVVVRPAEGDVALGGWKFELVAGFHRVAAAAGDKHRQCFAGVLVDDVQQNG
jgi:ParB-like chromosome segregation protein Spo0J